MSSEDITMITEILSGYTNPSNEIRSKAEIKLNELRQNLGAIIYCLLSVTSNHSLLIQLRKTALVLARKILVKDSKNSWKDINSNLKSEIKDLSIKLFLSETDAYLKQKYCDVISEILNITFDQKEQWTEIHQLTIFLYTNKPLPIISTQEDVIQMKAMISLLKNSIIFFSEDIEVNMDNFSPFILHLFKHDSIELKIACSKLIEQFLSMCDTEAVTEIPLFLCCIYELAVHCFNIKDEYNLLKVISILGEIAENRSEFMLFIFTDILSFVSKITKMTPETEMFQEREKICEAAFELEMTIIELEPAIFCEKPEYLKTCIIDLYSYAFEMPRVISNEWIYPTVNDFESLDVISEDQVRFVHEILNRLLLVIKGNKIQEITLQCIKEMLTNENDWAYIYIGLISISQVMCYMDSIKPIFDYIPFVNKMLINSNSKIRFAAANCLDQLADCFISELNQDDINKTIIMFTSLAFNEQIPCVQCKYLIAASTFIMYTHEAESLETINRDLLDNLLKFFLKEDIGLMSRREVLNCIQELINKIDDHSKPYADTILQILMKYFVMIYQKGESRCLYGILLDNITLIGSYSDSLYCGFVPDLIKAIISIIDSLKENINPIRNHIQNSIERLLPITVNRFQDMLPILIKSVICLFKSLKELMVKEKLKSITTEEKDDNNDEEVENEEEEEDKDKATLDPDDYVDCVKLLESFAESLEEEFIPYYREINTDLLEIYQLIKTHKIRSSTAHLFAVMIETMPDDNIERNNEAKKYISVIMSSIEEESFHYSHTKLFLSIKTILEAIDPIFTKEEVHRLFEKIVDRYGKYELSRVRLWASKNQKQPSSIDVFNEQIKDYENALKEIIEILGTIIKIYKAISNEMVDACINKIIPSFINISKNTIDNLSASYSQQMMIFLVDDLIEFLGEEYFTVDHWSFLFKILYDSTTYTAKPLIRALSYGIGTFAKMTSNQTYEQYASLSIEVLLKLSNNSNNGSLTNKSKNSENVKKGKEAQLAQDNIAAAFGKIIKYQSTSSFIQSNFVDIINSWIEKLPIKKDTSEMEEQHELLCKIIFNDNGLILKRINGIVMIQCLLQIYKTSNKTINQQIEAIFKVIKEDKDIQTIMEKIYQQQEISDHLKKKLKALIQ